MQANLPLVPTEIVEIIARDLQRRELCSFRLVCRDLYLKSLWIFAQRHSTVKTDLSAQSVQKLVEMSNSAYLAPRIRTFHIQADEEGYLGRGFEWRRNTSGGFLDPLPGATGMLRDILKNKFVNCRSFQIDSYGRISKQKESGWLKPADVIALMCFIVVNANLHIKSLTVGGQNEPPLLSSEIPDWLSPVHFQSLCLHREKENQETLLPWRSLISLILRFGLTTEHHGWALRLLKNAPSIRQLWLRLDLEEYGTFFPLFAALGPFYSLECLSLDVITLNGTAFSRFLLQHGNKLRCLALRYVQLAPDSINGDAGTSWETVFRDMIGQMHGLERFAVRWLWEVKDWRSAIVFPSLSAEDSYPVLPGSEERVTGIADLGADARVVAGLESPIHVRYQFIRWGKWIYGVEYEGKQMDGFLSLLIKAEQRYFQN